jgi:hypothetical protein
MPLSEGTSSDTFSSNVRELLQVGYPKKQALAISYSQKRKAQKKKGRIKRPKKS